MENAESRAKASDCFSLIIRRRRRLSQLLRHSSVGPT
jgi:hypothetical protein